MPKRGGTVRHPLVVRSTHQLLWAGQPEPRSHLHVWTSRVPEPLPARPLCVRSRPFGGRSRTCCARHGARRSRPPWEELGSVELGQDHGVEGIPRRGPARRGGGCRRGRPSFAHEVGRCSSARYPQRFTQEFFKADRGRRILVDTGRNGVERDDRRGVRGACEARRSRVGAVHVAGAGARRRASAGLHVAYDAGTTRRRG